MGVSAKVVADSVAHGSRLITLEIELHRFILPEFNTHRSFSRNFQSSRALPLSKQRELISKDTAMPVYWGANEGGMVANQELEPDKKARAQELWLDACAIMCNIHEEMEELGVHKQIANRLLEPFMYTRGIVTATEKAFDAFFKLRCASDAQPEISALAHAMLVAIGDSKPIHLEEGDWHLPYVNLDTFEGTLEEAVKVSVSCCAQVSYRNLDDSIDKAIKIYDMLNLNTKGSNGGNPHASPCEHQAKVATEADKYNAVYRAGGAYAYCGNLSPDWVQYRKMLGV